MTGKTKWLSLTALGIALFVVLSMCLRVPVFENYYLCLGYIAMEVYCYSIGTVSGTLTGCLGVVLYCVLTGGLRGMPGWTLGNVAIGIILGLTFRYTGKLKNIPLKTVLNIIAIVAATALGILVLKSETESLLYAQPFAARVVKNMYAFTADIAVLILSLPLCMTLDRYMKNNQVFHAYKDAES